MLHVKFLRSRYAHARVLRIDTSRACAAPGVVAVITGQDVPFNRMGAIRQDQPVLADERVRYLGDPLAAVAAETEESALQALRLVDVEYDELAAVFDPLQAIEPGAPLLHGDSNVLARQGLRCGGGGGGLGGAGLGVGGA